MPYITREDGEHFVIPSYRDVLNVRQTSQLKKEILLLSQSYGEYITLQKKSVAQYEVAFSPDTGYLLGESIWHHFKKPVDMIYCEAIPNTTEAILVIVKSSGVYLDGSFPLDSIPEELIIFLTQQNNFEIYTYGDVPISESAESGKFSFEPGSVKSFQVLDKPVFPTLPLLKIYQLQLVDPVLKEQGIGIFPIKQILSFVVIAGLVWMGWWYLTSEREEAPREAATVNPYQFYLNTLSSPDPYSEITQLINMLNLMETIPGWSIKSISYTSGSVTASVLSSGGSVEDLLTWTSKNNMLLDIKTNGIYITTSIQSQKRPYPTEIYSIKKVVAVLVDRLATVYPGNNLTLGNFVKKGLITDVTITVNLRLVSLFVLDLIAKQFKNLPLVIRTVSLEASEGNLYNGTITLEAMGS